MSGGLSHIVFRPTPDSPSPSERLLPQCRPLLKSNAKGLFKPSASSAHATTFWSRFATMLSILCLVLTFLGTYVDPLYGQDLTWMQSTEDRLNVGNFVILQCGAGNSSSKAEELSLALTDMATNLQDVIDDTALGDMSEHGYASFFKTPASRNQVRVTYKLIKQGFPVRFHPTTRLQSSYRQPTVICVNDNDPSTFEMQDACNYPGTSGIQPIYIPGVVGICPLFWALKAVPEKQDCPIVTSYNKLTTPTQATMIDWTRYSSLVHELAHLYISNGPRETYGMQACVDLSATASLTNAQSFALYASTTRANCTQFPSSVDQPDLDR